MTTLVKSPPRKVEISGYAALRERVKATLLEGQQKIEQEKVRTYWQAGKHIKEHLLLNKERADLGQRVIQKLAEDLALDETILWRSLKFARAFPVLAARQELTWAHYRSLIAIPDEKKRLALAEQAAKEEWTSRELEVEVRNRKWSERLSKDEKGKAARLPMTCLGSFYTYQIIQAENVSGHGQELRLDLGFSHKLSMDLFPDSDFKAGSIVTSVKSAQGRYSLKKILSPPGGERQGEEALLYTYKAYVEKVLDGDTLKVEFQLGFGNYQTETIRLNSIDCPELNTPEGVAAKKFVESVLKNCDFITIKSVKTRKEKWGRYLGDVFLPARNVPIPAGGTRRTNAGYEVLRHSRNPNSHPRESGDPGSLKPVYKSVGNDKISTGSTQATRLVCLNQLLLDKGHAVKVRS